MVNHRSKSKARAAAPVASLKREQTITTSDHSDLSETALRKLTRSELQKLAMAHKVKANMKSELIIQQLSKLQATKRTRPSEDGPEEGPSRKRAKTEAASEAVSPDSQLNQDIPAQTGAEDPPLPEAGTSAPRSTSPARKTPTALPYDEALFSGTESEMTEEEQLDFATPVSSRGETPPPANLNDLKRCVKIMQEISTQDVTLLNEAKGVREAAAKLRKRARDVRDLVKAESWRRERMEAYFRYWQETEPAWDRKWLYGENVPDHEDSAAGPSSIPNGQPRAEQPPTPIPGRRPMLSPEEVKKKREAIIAKQEAERRELEALRRREMESRSSSEEGSNRADDGCNPGGANLLLTGENDNVDRPSMISFGNAGTFTIPVPSP